MIVAVIGGGAAGFFAALSVRHHYPTAQVVLLEKTAKTLVKVKVSGGGRCNVTHNALDRRKLLMNYPRGAAFLKVVTGQFSVQHTINWFSERGVPLKIEKDGRMFPESNSSQTIIDLFMDEAQQGNIQLKLKAEVSKLVPQVGGTWLISTQDEELSCDRVIVTTGGKPSLSGFEWIQALGHSIIAPVPSLFTFNLKDKEITSLAGLSVASARVKIQGTDFAATAPLLITHWGFSGPAVLKCSAFGARHIADHQYNFTIQVNWLGNVDEESWRNSSSWKDALLSDRLVVNQNPTPLPSRLWQNLLDRAEIPSIQRWKDLPKKSKNRLVNLLTNDVWEVAGKTTFKEEFVTAGGIDLNEVDPSTMQSKLHPGLYFAGEVLDIDGVTGGFNFQAAWSTAFVAGKLT